MGGGGGVREPWALIHLEPVKGGEVLHAKHVNVSLMSVRPERIAQDHVNVA